MPDPDPAGNISGTLLLSLLFLLLTALFSAVDEAFEAVGDARIRELEEGDDRKSAGRAALIRRMTDKPRQFSGRVRLGLLLNGLLLAAAVLRCFAGTLTQTLAAHLPLLGASVAAWLLLMLAAAVCVAVFGYQLPRRAAGKQPEDTALSLAPLFVPFYTLLWPLDALCRLLAFPFLRLGGVDPREYADTVTEEDIRELMDAGEEIGAIEGAQKDMVNNIFEFDDITAAEIMTPRTDVAAVEADAPVEEALHTGVDNGYSRIPVYEEDIDHIIGILYIKDLLPYVGQPLPAGVTVRSLLRDTHFVPDTKKCDELFEEMNEKHLQMAIVVDEYGGVAGIVTMEDLLESIVGNMQDEFDHEEEEVTQLDDHSFIVDGSLNIDDLNELLGLALPEGDYDTVAGFLMDQLGHIPEPGEQAAVRYENAVFTIRRMDDRRIEQVLVQVEPEEAAAPAGED